MHLTPETISQAFKEACLAELQAIKPGNVHIFADGHGMVVQDFIKSANVVAQVIALPNLRVGQRILKAVEATQASVACNTNLGIVLLSAVIVQAALSAFVQAAYSKPAPNLQLSIQQVLNTLSVEDAEFAYQAIRLAKPAGLGLVPHHDVNAAPNISLLAAMNAAKEHDLIAQQYSNGFADIMHFGLNSYQFAMQKWSNPTWATTYVYLSFLAHYPDSHVARKYGVEVSKKLSAEAQQRLMALAVLDNPKLYLSKLIAWDADLKQRQLNPGTSADLTVATLLAVELL
ncbi:MAG: triphosphoribosyl-dephospho-CoA synthase [Methylophilaceae bacterium]|nr:triphosphoribosyl-dephospho-CoA synthase [Methylophilaceae bacterium]